MKRMEALCWYWRFLLMIILARRLNSRESGAVYDLGVLTQLWCNPDCFNSADFHVGAHVVMKRWQGRLPRGTAHHTDDFADHLVRRAYSTQALKRRSVKIHRSQSRLPPTPATGMQPGDHRNALDRKVLQKTQLAMAQSQICHRFASAPKLRQNLVLME
jgi:hypothetical protein